MEENHVQDQVPAVVEIENQLDLVFQRPVEYGTVDENSFVPSVLELAVVREEKGIKQILLWDEDSKWYLPCAYLRQKQKHNRKQIAEYILQQRSGLKLVQMNWVREVSFERDGFTESVLLYLCQVREGDPVFGEWHSFTHLPAITMLPGQYLHAQYAYADIVNLVTRKKFGMFLNTKNLKAPLGKWIAVNPERPGSAEHIVEFESLDKALEYFHFCAARKIPCIIIDDEGNEVTWCWAKSSKTPREETQQ